MADHPFRTAADSVDANVTEAGVTETFLDAMLERVPFALSATEDLVDYSFDAGSIPLSLVYGKTGYVYFYNADDTTSADDGLTVLVSGDGRRYILADSSAIAITSVLAIENDPPVSPNNGDAYIVDTAPTGDWVGHSKDIALKTPRGWVFAAPKVGTALLNEDTEANVQYSVAGVWGAMATALDVDAVTPDLLQFPMGLSVEAQQNAPPVSITIGLHYLVGTSGSGAWAGHSNDIAYSSDGSTWAFMDAYDGATIFNKSSDATLTWFDATGDWRATWPINAECHGRLTLESGVPVSITDQSAKATLYFTPYKGNTIALYVNGGWALRTFTEKSLSLAGYTTAKPFDIFGYDNAGVLALESLVWTNDTTRATALTTQDGVYVKSGDATRRYLGTIYTSATGQCSDTLTQRYVWNEYNRIARPMMRTDTTNSWTYNTSSFRQANGSASNQLDFVLGRAEETVRADAVGNANNAGGATNPVARTAIGLDSTTARATSSLASPNVTATAAVEMVASFEGYLTVGRHYLAWLEWASTSAGSVTFLGDDSGNLTQSGIRASVFA